jgi:hypothetical protein
MREGSIPESIARQLVGRKHATGEFVSYESHNGKFTVTSKCSNCSGSHANISIINANQAASNPSVPLINCQWCKRVIDAPQAQTYEDVIRIPESHRSSAQQRIVVEHENAERNAQRTATKQAPINAARVQANRAIKASMFESHERFLTALAHITLATYITDPRVIQHESYVSWPQWQAMSDEDREKTNHWVGIYWANNGLASLGI